MKRNILISFFALVLLGCLPEDREGCPEDLGLIFSLEDEYEAGNFDTRVASDVILAVFNNKTLATVMSIDYDDIAEASEFVIRKDENFVGHVEMVAWAASMIEGYDPSGIPDPEENLDSFSIGLRPITRATGNYYNPAECGLYVGVEPLNEKIDETSTHTINMIHSSCRVEVHVTDGLGVMSGAAERAVAVHGSMSRMNIGFQGIGEEAIVWTPLDKDGTNDQKYSTGRFGIMPSADGQTVSVEILNDTETVALLTVPNSALPTGAQAGSLIVFEYVIGEAEFRLTVNGFTQRVFIVKGA